MQLPDPTAPYREMLDDIERRWRAAGLGFALDCVKATSWSHRHLLRLGPDDAVLCVVEPPLDTVTLALYSTDMTNEALPANAVLILDDEVDRAEHIARVHRILWNQSGDAGAPTALIRLIGFSSQSGVMDVIGAVLDADRAIREENGSVGK